MAVITNATSVYLPESPFAVTGLSAGVPMGCYFLTLSLVAGMGNGIGILGIILPVYAIIDMIETAVNVWSDACVCAIVDKSIKTES